MSKLQRLLKVRRTAKGMTQRQAAAEVGVSRTSWNHWETGRAVPSAEHVPALAVFLSRNPADPAEIADTANKLGDMVVAEEVTA